MNLFKSIIVAFFKLIFLILGVIGFICYFYNARQFNTDGIHLFKTAMVSILSFNFWIEFFKNYQDSGQNYTFKIIFSSLLFICILFLVYAFFYRFLKNKNRLVLNRLLASLETLPVVTLVLLLQWGFIGLYKVTGYHILATIGTPRQPVFFVPFLILSLFPFVFVINYMSNYIEDAYQSDYFFFAQSLGFSYVKLFFSYILPNLIRPLEVVIGFVYLDMLSAMIFIELQFNTGGILTDLYTTLMNFQTSESHIFISAYVITLLLPYALLKVGIKSYRLIS